jgi:signal transduction histidine kinase
MEWRGDILVVDDNRHNQEICRINLELEDYRVTVAEDGAEGLAMVREARPDLILLDLMMPVMDGFEFLEAVRGDPELRDTPILVISAKAMSDDVVRAFQLGARDYVRKPFEVNELVARVDNLVSLSRARRELEERGRHTKLLYHRLNDNYQSLKRLESHRDQLVHMVAHDMRSPLSGVSGYLQLARQQFDDGDLAPLRDCLDKSLKMTEHLARMINDMLNVSSMESERMPLCWNRVDVVDLIRSTVEPIAKGDGRDIRLGVPVGRRELECDVQVVSRVLDNLIRNALQHGPADGSVTVKLVDRETVCRLEVMDQGPGIPPAQQKRIFDKYARMDDSGPETRAGSSGLGLTFCQLAVETHGGEIGVDSDGENGSIFWIELPWKRCDNPPAEAPDRGRADDQPDCRSVGSGGG